MAEVLADTSVWVDHLRNGNPALSKLLQSGVVWSHDFVIGELACGNLARRQEILDALAELPRVDSNEHVRVLRFLEGHELLGKGLGWVDLHLLVAATDNGLKLWSFDKRLATAAGALNVAIDPA